MVISLKEKNILDNDKFNELIRYINESINTNEFNINNLCDIYLKSELNTLRFLNKQKIKQIDDFLTSNNIFKFIYYIEKVRLRYVYRYKYLCAKDMKIINEANEKTTHKVIFIINNNEEEEEFDFIKSSDIDNKEVDKLKYRFIDDIENFNSNTSDFCRLNIDLLYTIYIILQKIDNKHAKIHKFEDMIKNLFTIPLPASLDHICDKNTSILSLNDYEYFINLLNITKRSLKKINSIIEYQLKDMNDFISVESLLFYKIIVEDKFKANLISSKVSFPKFIEKYLTETPEYKNMNPHYFINYLYQYIYSYQEEINNSYKNKENNINSFIDQKSMIREYIYLLDSFWKNSGIDIYKL